VLVLTAVVTSYRNEGSTLPVVTRHSEYSALTVVRGVRLQERKSNMATKEQNRRWYEANKEYHQKRYAEDKQGFKTRLKELRKDVRYQMVANAKQRAKKTGIPFDLHFTDLVLPDVCPILGIPLQKGEGRREDYSPSIDRVHNDRGYVKGNVAIISWKANKMKSDLSLETTKSLVKYMESYNA